MRKKKQEQLDETELRLNVEWIRNQKELIAWVANMKVISNYDESEHENTCLLVYVMSKEGQTYKLLYDIQPYFFVECEQEFIQELALHLENKFEKTVSKVEIIDKVDLDEINHLSGNKKKFIKLSFRVISDLLTVRNQLRARCEANQKRQQNNDLIKKQSTTKDLFDTLINIREYDVPYHCRVCIDTGLRCCKWFKFKIIDRRIQECVEQSEILSMPNLRYISFDIETTKQPLKFPDAKNDKIMMISLTHSENSILITNMETLGQEVQDFDYAPKQEFQTRAIIYNEINEKGLLMRFFNIITDYKPLIISSFNGDKFDWPFIEERCLSLGFYLENEIGLKRNEETNEFYGRFLIHMDCFAWVERDAYLPQGSHGLKAVTRAKLGYEPVEVDPEKMVEMALNNSQEFAGYSISDSVATYWLYKKHIHDFILALCTIIPLSPDEVLRKGSGTLCECLLMAQAFQRQIIFPNKTLSNIEKFYDGHLVDSETYIGGKVECLRSGIYRSDIDIGFKLDKECMQSMWNGVERLIKFIGKIENQTFSEEAIDTCATEIRNSLNKLMERGESFQEKPLIYHLDVAAMYPNIILTNRLQPVSIVDNRICSVCVFNSPENQCKRPLEWQKRVEYYPLQRNEYEQVKAILELEQVEKSQKEIEQQQNKFRMEGLDKRNYNPKLKRLQDLPYDQQSKIIKQRVKIYCQKTYKAIHQHETKLHQDTVCMRENDFYVQTVRDFRDRRYEFKELVKVYKSKLEIAKKEGKGTKECIELMALYESLQLAHKIILNSFYGYVMRKGARWYSMQMAGIVTHMGSQIISTAKHWVDQIGLPLELDTDGIWCLLPNGFPEDFYIQCESGKKLKFSYPCYILNELVYDKYKNNQYQWLKNQETLDYGIKSEMSIFFEVDGPYKCMIIPAAREENKQLKKRYVVYNKNGTIAEIKGFEIKRRGELQIIKQFQQDLFSEFLKGNTLQECYNACAQVGKRLLDILTNGGDGLEQSQILELIGESKVLTKEISEYDSQKGVAITAARRIAEYLGTDQMKGGSLKCLYIITKLPLNQPVNQRSIPLLIFEANQEVRKKFLRRWLKEPQLQDDDLTLKKMVDWNYYIERLKNTIQKLLVIPAALQKMKNPIPEVQPPDWLYKRLREEESGLQQTKLNKYFTQVNKLQQQFAQIRFQPIELEDGRQISVKKKTHQEDKILHNPYSMENDFRKFLQTQKQIWTKEYQRKQSNPTRGGNLKNMFKFNQQQLLSSVWQILQYYEIGPGIFGVWILLENGTHTQLQIQIDRTIYVNSFQKQHNETQVKKTLPREKKVHYLYVVTMEEQRFLEEYSGFSQFEANPDYEGIYEQNIPLMFKIIAELGSMCKLGTQYQQQKSIYKFEELQGVFQLQNSEPYLQKQQKSLFSNSYVIQHFQLKDNISVWTIIQNEEALIIFVRKENQEFSKQQIVLNIKQVHEQIEIKRKQLKTIQALFPERNRITIQLLKDDKMAYDYINNHFETKSQGTKLCLLQSNKELTYLQNQGLHFLCTKLPTLCLPKAKSIKRDFQWDINILKLHMESYCSMSSVLNSYIELARYALIPLCNLSSVNLGKIDQFKNENEKLNFITDVLYQRALRQLTPTISWYGSGLGRDNRDLIPTEFTNSFIEYSGMYMDYTVEIDILHFSINTIALADELKNLDREASSLISQKVDVLDNLDELVGAKTAFKILKLLVQSWLDDIYQRNEQIADYNIQNISCWIYSGQSPLYDPYLGKMVKRLNFKMFNILTTKLTQLGAKIIFASQNRLLISTGKQSLDTAKGYIEYIIETLKSQLLFKYLDFRPAKYYTSLIYKDQYNFLGSYIIPETMEIDYDISLKLQEFLPKQSQQFYVKTLFAILEYTIQFKANQLNEISFLSNNIQILRTSTLAQDTIIALTKHIEDTASHLIYNGIELQNENFKIHKKNFEQYLEQEKTIAIDQLNVKKNKKIIEDEDLIDEEDINQNDEDYEKDSFIVSDNEDEVSNHSQNEQEQIEDGKVENFPKNWCMPYIIGQKFPQNDDEPPTLKLVVYLCAMLSVDEEVHQIVKRVKSNCCRILKVSEHSREANFIDPCIDLTLYNIPCYNCYMVADLNIFKKEWRCPGCVSFYEQSVIEQKVCQYLEQQILFYQIQDLYCKKCKQTQDYPFQDRCSCSSSFGMQLKQFEKPFVEMPAQLFESLSKLSIEKNLQGLKTLISSISF